MHKCSLNLCIHIYFCEINLPKLRNLKPPPLINTCSQLCRMVSGTESGHTVIVFSPRGYSHDCRHLVRWLQSDGPKWPHQHDCGWCWLLAGPHHVVSPLLASSHDSLTAPTGQERNCQGSLKPTFLVHQFCYNPLVKPGHKASPDSRGRKTDSTSWWEERQCHAAKPHTYRDVGATVAIFINHLPRSSCFSAHTQVCLVCLSPDSFGPSSSSSYFQFYARVEKGQLSCCKR